MRESFLVKQEVGRAVRGIVGLFGSDENPWSEKTQGGRTIRQGMVYRRPYGSSDKSESVNARRLDQTATLNDKAEGSAVRLHPTAQEADVEHRSAV